MRMSPLEAGSTLCTERIRLSGVASQLSLAVTLSVTATHCGWPAIEPSTGWMDATTGGAVSSTQSTALHVVELPDASVTVTLMQCAPVPTNVPAAGVCVFVSASEGVQLSTACRLASKSGTSVPQR